MAKVKKEEVIESTPVVKSTKVETIAPKIEPLSLDLGKEEFNLIVSKLNEVINKING